MENPISRVAFLRLVTLLDTVGVIGECDREKFKGVAFEVDFSAIFKVLDQLSEINNYDDALNALAAQKSAEVDVVEMLQIKVSVYSFLERTMQGYVTRDRLAVFATDDRSGEMSVALAYVHYLGLLGEAVDPSLGEEWLAHTEASRTLVGARLALHLAPSCEKLRALARLGVSTDELAEHYKIRNEYTKKPIRFGFCIDGEVK